MEPHVSLFSVRNNILVPFFIFFYGFLRVPVPANLQFAGVEHGDLQSPISTLALMAITCFGGKDNGFHPIAHAFFHALQMLIFEAGGLQIRQNGYYQDKALHTCKGTNKINTSP
jgi:hypothetical protein